MALGQCYGARLTIARYLEDEERAFLELISPGEKFTEPSAPSFTVQQLANYVARVGWVDAVLWMRDHAAASLMMVAAAEGGQTRVISITYGWGARELRPAYARAIAGGHCEAAALLEELNGPNGVNFFEDLTRDAVCEAARNGHLRMVERMMGDRKSFSYREDLLAHAASTGQLHVMEAVWKHAESHGCAFHHREPYFAAIRGGALAAMKRIDTHINCKPGTLAHAAIDVFMDLAAMWGRPEIMEYLRGLCCDEITQSELEALAITAIKHNETKVIGLLMKWGKPNLAEVLHVYSLNPHSIDAVPTDALRMLRALGVPGENFRHAALNARCWLNPRPHGGLLISVLESIADT